MQELFGPLSMRALEEDKYVRQTRGYLPEAEVGCGPMQWTIASMGRCSWVLVSSCLTCVMAWCPHGFGMQIAFIDEIFKANSAILNTLLTLVNER